LLAFGEGPSHEIDELLRFDGIRLVLVYEQPGERGDRIRILARRVHDADAIIRPFAELFRRAFSGRGDRLERRLDELAIGVLDRRIRKFVLDRVGDFDVPDRPRGLLDLAGNTFVTLAAEPDRP